MSLLLQGWKVPYPTKTRILWILMLVPILFPVVAKASPVEHELDGIRMAMDLLGGLALFLLGLDRMSGSLKAVAGDQLRIIMARLTTNRFSGVLTGALTTAIIQSSSVTTVLVVGFVSAGLISLPQSIGIIFGAEIGTTITAQIIAFKITRYALPMIALGFALVLAGRGAVTRQVGQTIIGLGMIFFGMGVMSTAMAPLRTHPPFINMMLNFEHPLAGILLAVLFTSLVQSSSATIGIVIVFASQGLITMPAGIALIFGANIGTCVTALLASIGKSREAVRTALVHVLFNTLGVLLWLAIIGIDSLIHLSAWISPLSEQLSGQAQLAADTPRQLANAHALFNILNTLLFLPFVGSFAYLVERLLPDSSQRRRRIDSTVPTTAKTHRTCLDQKLLATPNLAVDRIRQEICKRMGGRLRRMYWEVLPAMLDNDKQALMILAEMDHEVDLAHAGVIEYLGKISEDPADEIMAQELTDLIAIANHLENIGDVIETNMVYLGHQRILKRIKITTATRGVITRFYDEVGRALEDCIASVANRDCGLALQVLAKEAEILQLFEEAAHHQTSLLVEGRGGVAPYALKMDIYDKLNRIYYYTNQVAKAVVPDSEQTSKSK